MCNTAYAVLAELPPLQHCARSLCPHWTSDASTQDMRHKMPDTQANAVHVPQHLPVRAVPSVQTHTADCWRLRETSLLHTAALLHHPPSTHTMQSKAAGLQPCVSRSDAEQATSMPPPHLHETAIAVLHLPQPAPQNLHAFKRAEWHPAPSCSRPRRTTAGGMHCHVAAAAGSSPAADSRLTSTP